MNDDTTSRGGRKSSGFTIVETLIVLAITGFLLLIAMLIFAGQTAKVEFSQSIRDTQSVIQQTINEVGSGFYPNGGNIGCTVSGAGLDITTSAVAQGTNTDCIFLGKVMQFGVDGTDPQRYNIFTMAGFKNNDGDLTKARPQIVDIPSATSIRFLHYGLKVVGMRYVIDGQPTKIGAVAFVSGLGSLNSSNQMISGTQQMSLVPVPSSGQVPNTVDSTVIDAVKAQLPLATTPVNPNGGVEICIASGGTKQSGLITIGGSGRGVSVKLEIKNSVDCT